MTAGASPVAAQTLTTGRIQGAVVDAGNAAVSNAVVTLRDAATSTVTTRELNSSGEFSFLFLAPGAYDLTVEAFGHRPLRIESVEVQSGRTTHVQAELSGNESGNAPTEIRRHSGSVRSALTDFPTALISRFPDAARPITSIARFSSLRNSTLSTEGLPGYLSAAHIDGVGFGAPSMRGHAVAPTLPLSAVRHAELAMNADVEWNGTAAPALAVHFSEPSRAWQLSTFGDWTSGPARTGELNSPVYSGFRAGALVSGPLVRDTGGLVLGVEFWRVEAPIAFSARTDSAAAHAIDIAESQFGLAGSRYALSRVTNADAIAAFTNTEWHVGDKHTITGSAAVTSLPAAVTLPALRDRVGARAGIKGLDAVVSASVRSQFSETTGQEFRLAWDRSVRDYDAVDGGIDVTSTLFVSDDAFSLGRDPSMLGRYETNTFRLRETLHLWKAGHHVKAGALADLASYDQIQTPTRNASFWFGSMDDFANATGYAVQTNGAAIASFSMPRFGVFLQDDWSLNPRLRILLGARWDAETPPVEDVAVNEEFLVLSGLRADSGLTRRGRLSPRFEFEWRPDVEGRWTIRGSAGVWSMPMDPFLVGEVLANSGAVEVTRGFGTFAEWPAPEVSNGAISLTLPAPGYQGPRSKRGTIQVNAQVARGVQLNITGIYRRTDLLPIRTDLNRALIPVAHDQYGRELYGVLRQQGSLLAPDSVSNRRFAGFDVVSAIGVDGWSDYRSVSTALQVQLADAFFVHANYTYSQTEDNWFMAREAGTTSAISPFTGSDVSEWTEGTSDFDVPHRAVIAAEFSLPSFPRLRVSGMYRYRSGYPFTPGFRDGVDANGDGSARNDPAFVDDEIAGFDELSSKWSCLGAQVGEFASRNSCRAPAASFLDARMTFGLLNRNGNSAEIVVDVLNLVRSGGDELDHALYLVDPAGTLTTSASGIVTVPLKINPGFGAPLMRAGAERALRVGLRVRY